MCISLGSFQGVSDDFGIWLSTALINKPESSSAHQQNVTVKCHAVLTKLPLHPGLFVPGISYLPSSHFGMLLWIFLLLDDFLE